MLSRKTIKNKLNSLELEMDLNLNKILAKLSENINENIGYDIEIDLINELGLNKKMSIPILISNQTRTSLTK